MLTEKLDGHFRECCAGIFDLAFIDHLDVLWAEGNSSPVAAGIGVAGSPWLFGLWLRGHG